MHTTPKGKAQYVRLKQLALDKGLDITNPRDQIKLVDVLHEVNPDIDDLCRRAIAERKFRFTIEELKQGYILLLCKIAQRDLEAFVN